MKPIHAATGLAIGALAVAAPSSSAQGFEEWTFPGVGTWSDNSNWADGSAPTGDRDVIVREPGGVARIMAFNGVAGEDLVISDGARVEVGLGGDLTLLPEAGSDSTRVLVDKEGALSVDGAGSVLTAERLQLRSGAEGEPATVTVNNGGLLKVTQISFAGGHDELSLNILGGPGGVGIIDAINIGSSAEDASAVRVTFDHVDPAYHFTTNGADDGGFNALAGHLSVEHLGAGTTYFHGINTYSQGTTVRQGRLILQSPGFFGQLAEIDHPDAELLVGVEDGDDASLTLQENAEVVSGIGRIGEGEGSRGVVTVAGDNLWLVSGDYLNIGAMGDGELNIAEDARVSVSGTVRIAAEGGVGALNIGMGETPGELNAPDILTGENGEVNFNHSAGDYHFTHNGDADGAPALIQGFGRVSHIGAGTTTLPGVYTYAGGTTVNNGTLRVTGSIDHVASLLVVGENDGDDGTLRINDGGAVTSRFARIAASAGSAGHAGVTGPGSAWTNMDEDGLNDVHVGLAGAGSLEINDQGLVECRDGTIGLFADGDGSAVVSGEGSLWYVDRDLIVGGDGAGELTIKDGGVVEVVGNGRIVPMLRLGGDAGALNIGDGGAPGVLSTSVRVLGVGGDAAVNFNHDAPDYHFTTNGDGDGAPILINETNFSLAVNHIGDGVTTLTAESLYSGPTTIDAGTLRINGSALNTTTTVNAGGAFGGTGAVGPVIVNGGAIAPGASAGTLTAASLTLDPQAALEYELGDPAQANDRIDVLGDLTLDGALNVADAGGLSKDAAYVLVTYTGELTDNGLELGDVPDGFNFMIDTSTPGEVLLMSACPSDLNGDGAVGPTDLGILLSAWGDCPAEPAPCVADLDGDGQVGSADLGTLLAGWGACE